MCQTAHLLIIVADGDGCCVGEDITKTSGLVLLPKPQDVVEKLLRSVHVACLGELFQQGGPPPWSPVPRCCSLQWLPQPPSQEAACKAPREVNPERPEEGSCEAMN